MRKIFARQPGTLMEIQPAEGCDGGAPDRRPGFLSKPDHDFSAGFSAQSGQGLDAGPAKLLTCGGVEGGCFANSSKDLKPPRARQLERFGTKLLVLTRDQRTKSRHKVASGTQTAHARSRGQRGQQPCLE